jgi:hypothetical protein
MDTEPKTVIAAIERLEAEMQRRIEEKIAKGEAIRAESPFIVGVPDPEIDYTAVRHDADGREIYPAEPFAVIVTGVPRPGRDDKYIERHDQECTKQDAEELRQREKEAAARVAAFHEGAKSHEPEYKPPPMSKPEALPELEWRGVWVQIRSPDHERNDPGEIAEARYAVSNGLIYVEDAEGRRLGVQELAAGEDAAAVARGIARRKLGGEKFFAPIAYPNLSLV